MIFFSCTKIATTDIGGELLPPGDNVNTKEMFLNLVSKNGRDSFTTVGTKDVQSLGYTNDPMFGKTRASINVQLKPDGFPFKFPVSKDSLILDSAVLILRYEGAYGDTLQNLQLRVFEMSGTDTNSNIKPSSYYRTNYHIDSLPEELTAAPKNVFIPSLKDSTGYYWGGKNANVVRIRLTDDFGNRLLHDYDTSNAYKNDSLFDVYFKGFQIVPEATGNAFLKINLVDTNTQMALYYKYKRRDSAGKVDTTIASFRCNTSFCGSTNYIERNRSASEADMFISANHSTPNDSLIYIDANPGYFATVSIPNTDTIRNKIIHRAEIIIDQVPDAITTYDNIYTPPNLFLTTYSADSMRRFALPNDMVISNGTVANQITLGCFPVKKIDPLTGRTINEYRMDVSRYLQGIITFGQKYYDLVLWAPYNDYISISEASYYVVFTGSGSTPLNRVAVGRIRLGGGSSINYKMKLRVVYSDL